MPATISTALNPPSGPTLTEVNKKYERRNEFLQHVLQPSLKVDEKFAAYAVITNSGQVITGLLAKQTDASVTLKTPDRGMVTIPQSEIEEIKKSPRSLMPNGVLADLTAQEAADLLAFLRSVGR